MVHVGVYCLTGDSDSAQSEQNLSCSDTIGKSADPVFSECRGLILEVTIKNSKIWRAPVTQLVKRWPTDPAAPDSRPA